MGMTIEEARELLRNPLWPLIRDHFLETGEFAVYPEGDFRRLVYLDAATRRSIELWREAFDHVAEWKKIVDGARVREIKAAYPGVYPEILRYELYFPNGVKDDAALEKLLMLKFPEAYKLCYS